MVGGPGDIERGASGLSAGVRHGVFYAHAACKTRDQTIGGSYRIPVAGTLCPVIAFLSCS